MYYLDTVLGRLYVEMSASTIYGIYWSDQKNFTAPKRALSLLAQKGGPGQLAHWLSAYFSGVQPSPADLVRSGLSLSPFGTEKQKACWELLLSIPYGKLLTYAELATYFQNAYGERTSPRAMGQLIGANPIVIVIPCHRVIASDGKLNGYSGGASRKAYLLRLEGSLIVHG